MDNPEAFIPRSYETRIWDNDNVPRDTRFFKSSYKTLKCSDVPASSRSFYLRYLHRSLKSRTKHEDMNMMGMDSFYVN